MKKAEKPQNENSRLAALHALNILDTAPEERFDRITRTAVRLFNVKVAAITLVDREREWFKSIEGADVRGGPRDTSLCGHTILENDMLIVENTTKDPRFSDNPKVVQGVKGKGQPLHFKSR